MSTDDGRTDGGPATPAPGAGTGIRFRAWNLLLLLPLVALVTPIFNRRTPEIGGVPFLYWGTILVIPLGVACTLAVHLLTRGGDEDGER